MRLEYVKYTQILVSIFLVDVMCHTLRAEGFSEWCFQKTKADLLTV